SSALPPIRLIASGNSLSPALDGLLWTGRSPCPGECLFVGLFSLFSCESARLFPGDRLGVEGLPSIAPSDPLNLLREDRLGVEGLLSPILLCAAKFPISS